MRTFVLALALTLGVSASAVAQQTPQSQAKTEKVTITGVVDEVGSDYFIATSTDFTPIAKLEGAGFGKENFARFVGMPVTARGTITTGADGKKVMKIANIGDIKNLPPPNTTE